MYEYEWDVYVITLNFKYPIFKKKLLVNFQNNLIPYKNKNFIFDISLYIYIYKNVSLLSKRHCNEIVLKSQKKG